MKVGLADDWLSRMIVVITFIVLIVVSIKLRLTFEWFIGLVVLEMLIDVFVVYKLNR